MKKHISSVYKCANRSIIQCFQFSKHSRYCTTFILIIKVEHLFFNHNIKTNDDDNGLQIVEMFMKIYHFH